MRRVLNWPISSVEMQVLDAEPEALQVLLYNGCFGLVYYILADL